VNIKLETVATQIRLSPDIYNYVQSEAMRLGISQNAVMNTLIDEGRRFREATVKCDFTIVHADGLAHTRQCPEK
jgi:hypothetical protein